MSLNRFSTLQDVANKVLVVDDDKVMCLLYSKIFNKRNIEVCTCLTLAEARKNIENNQYSLVVLDNHLSDGLGQDLLPYLLEFLPNVPIIMVTADDDQTKMEQCFKLGVSDYVLKPFNLELMWYKSKKLLDNFTLEKKVRQQSQHLESILYKQNLEEEMAFYVYTHMLGSVRTPDFISFASLSTDNFSGDIQLSATAPSGIHYILSADATGHGLSAAISLFPLISIFKAMIKKGFPIRMVLDELNLKLNEYIPPDRFITVILVELDVNKGLVGIWNGGMPTVLFLSKENRVISDFPSKNMALGILEENEFDDTVVYMPLPLEGKLLMYSDGLIEQCDSDGKEYGELRLHSLLECYTGDDLLETIMDSNAGFRGDNPLNDDISVSVLDFSKIIK